MSTVWVGMWGEHIRDDGLNLHDATIRVFTSMDAADVWAKSLSPEVEAWLSFEDLCCELLHLCTDDGWVLHIRQVTTEPGAP